MNRCSSKTKVRRSIAAWWVSCVITVSSLCNHCVQNSLCRLLADDCILYQRIRSFQDSDKLQADLDQLKKLESIWLKEFNTSKCQVISITNKEEPIIGRYQVYDHIQEQVNCAKYLSIYIDYLMLFAALTNSVCVNNASFFFLF